jgi:hypothetical protein
MSAVPQAKNQLVRCLYQLTCAGVANSVTADREIRRRAGLVLAARIVHRTASAALGGEAELRAVIAPSAEARTLLLLIGGAAL